MKTNPDIDNSYSVCLFVSEFTSILRFPSLSVTFDDPFVLSESSWIIRGLAAFFWQMLQNVKVKFFLVCHIIYTTLVHFLIYF